jgi:hypothetical protein
MTATTVWIVALLAVAAVAGAEGPLESLDTGAALAEVRGSRGVVFVDLYADW